MTATTQDCYAFDKRAFADRTVVKGS